jgi:PKD repeat protein
VSSRAAIVVLVIASMLALPSAAAADFGFQQTGPLTVQFTGPSGAVAYAWSFGDGQGSTDANPSHTFPRSGVYNVSLVAAPDTTAVTKPVTVYGAPVADFRASQQTGTLSVAFADRSSGVPTSWSWNFGDGQTSTEQSPSHLYAATGTYTVTLSVANGAGTSSVSKNVVIALPDRPPVAAFTATPNPSAVGVAVGFDAQPSTDPDGDRLSFAWDLDNDGQFDDGSLPTASEVFTTAGSHTVRLKVSDGRGQSDTQAEVVTVLDEHPPVASFGYTPGLPGIGEPVLFNSTSTDRDGTIARLDWDLDGDGAFDDASGPSAQWSFLTPGPHLVSLRATDDMRVSTVASQTVVVTAPQTAGSAPPPPPAVRPVVKLISPFPVVRVRARIIGANVYIDLLTVRAPKGTTVRLRCRGHSCPFARTRVKVRSARRPLRIRGIERRLVRGTVIQIFVTKPGVIGKYTRFVLRAAAAPMREDLCLPPGSMRPMGCPV